MAYTSYKQFAPNGYEFIDDKTGQTVMASGPEASLHARKIDSLYAPVDPMMQQAAASMQDDRLAEASPGFVESMRDQGKTYLDSGETWNNIKKWVRGDTAPPVATDAVGGPLVASSPPPMIAANPPPRLGAGDLESNGGDDISSLMDLKEEKLREKAGFKKETKAPAVKTLTAAPRLPDPNNWNMDKPGSQFLTEPTTREAMAERAYIGNEIAAAQSPTPPGPIEKLGPSVPVSRTGIVGASPAAVADAMAAQEDLAKANAAVEGRALDRQGFVDTELANIAQTTKATVDRQSAMIERDLAARERTEGVMNKLREELNIATDPNSAFNKKSTGDKITARLSAFMTGLGSYLLGARGKEVTDQMDAIINDDQKVGKITKRIEEAYKASGMLGDMADKKRAIAATQGLLQTQAILAKIDALKAANMTQLQRDKLSLVEREQLANQAMYTRDLEAQINGTVNYALAGSMKPKGGGGEGGDKALDNLIKFQQGRLANTYKLRGTSFELPPLNEGLSSKLHERVNAFSAADAALQELEKLVKSHPNWKSYDPMSAERQAIEGYVSDIAELRSVGNGQGAANKEAIDRDINAVKLGGGERTAKILRERLTPSINRLEDELNSYGGRKVNRLWLKKKTIYFMTTMGIRSLLQKVL